MAVAESTTSLFTLEVVLREVDADDLMKALCMCIRDNCVLDEQATGWRQAKTERFASAERNAPARECADELKELSK